MHPAVWEGRLSPLAFRRFEPADLHQCLELYKLNEPGRFPEGVIGQYEKALREHTSYFLVAEKEGKIVATGGMAYVRRPYIANLCFGLVSPGCQRSGIGTALVLARLALLKKEVVYRVFISAVAKSFGFYQRFGFRHCGFWRDPRKEKHPAGLLVITNAEAIQCRELLAEHGISVPHDEDQIPLRQRDENGASDMPKS